MGARIKSFICIFTVLFFAVTAFSAPPGTFIKGGRTVPIKPLSFDVWTSFAADDATPNVSSDTNFATANVNPTTITNLDGGSIGDIKYIFIGDANTTFDFTTSALYGNAGADYAANANDLMVFVKQSTTNWACSFIGKAAGGAGEANTASNVGTDGVGVFYQKTALDLEFRHIAPASTKVTVTLNGQDIDIDVAEANFAVPAANITTGTLLHERGGLEADVNAYSGLVGITGGATTEVNTAAELETFAGLGSFANEILDDENAAAVLVTIGAYATAAADAAHEAELDNSAGLLAALSDETGGGVGALAVFNINPTILDLTLGNGSGDAITQTAAAYDWDLIDNNASALSFDAAGKAGILAIVTTDAGEKVTLSGGLDVAGTVTLTTVLDMDYTSINALDTAITARDNTDKIAVWDTGAGGMVYITVGNFVSGLGGGGSAIVVDLEDDGGDDTSDLNEIAPIGDTNSIFAIVGDKMTITLSNDWPKADSADTLSTALVHELGGLEADISGYTAGLIGMAAGATLNVDTEAEIEAAITDMANIIQATEIDTESELETLVGDMANIIQETEIDTESELETIVGDMANIIQATEIDTESELEAIVGDMANIIQATEIDTFLELNALVADKTLINEEDAATIDSAWIHAANVTLDDGVTHSPSLIFIDATNETVTIVKTDGSNLDIDFNTASTEVIDIANAGAGDVDLKVDGAIFEGGTTLSTLYEANNALLGDIAGLSLTTGDIIYYDGANLAKLDSSATPGYYLQSGGAVAPVWAAGSGTGVAGSHTATDWNGDTASPQKNDLYDYFIIFDDDKDGDFTNETWYERLLDGTATFTALTLQATTGGDGAFWEFNDGDAAGDTDAEEAVRIYANQSTTTDTAEVSDYLTTYMNAGTRTTFLRWIGADHTLYLGPQAFGGTPWSGGDVATFEQLTIDFDASDGVVTFDSVSSSTFTFTPAVTLTGGIASLGAASAAGDNLTAGGIKLDATPTAQGEMGQASGTFRLYGDGLTLGETGDNDIVIFANANTNDGSITYMEDEDYWIFAEDALVPTEIYGAGWDGVNEVPTKDAVYDKIEALQPLDTELTLLSGLAETTGNVIISVGGAWASVAQPAIDGTNITNVTATHTGTITWGGTSILESGAAFQFGDASDATLTHTYANTGTNVSIAYSSAAMAVTGNLTATNLSGTNTGDDDVPDAGDFGAGTDLDSNGAVAWGNLAEGELANSTVVSADIKDGEIVAADLSSSIVVATTGLLSGGVITNSKAANYTIGTDSAAECYGGIIYVTSTCDITACDNLAAGMNFSVITIGATQVDVDVQSDDLMNLDGTALNDGDKAVNTSTAGDIISCFYYDATGWYCISGGTDGDRWTDGG